MIYMQSFSRYSRSVSTAQNGPQTNTKASSEALLASLTIIVPMMLVLVILGYKKYRIKVVQAQIAALEKAWKLSPSKEIF